MSQQRVLIITRNLPPLVGGMERLNWHMADELSKYAEVKVIGPKGAAAIKPTNVELLEAPLKPLGLFLLISSLRALWLAIRWKPDVILAGSGLTAPVAWFASKLCGAKSAVYLHGFDITVSNKLYQTMWTPIFKKMNHIIVNSTPTKQLALNAGVPEKKISIVYPGVELPTAPQPQEKIEAFKQKHQLVGKKVLLSVGRLTTRKGLKEFVEQALPQIIQAAPSAVLVIVGEAPKNSLGAGIQTQDEILQAAQKNGLEGHIKFLGVITDKIELATVYEAADVHVFPVRHIPDDPEGFGMVAIEAAAHGLPTVAFATGGVVDAVRKDKSGYLIEKNNYAEFCKQVVHALQTPMSRESIQVFSQSFAWCTFGYAIKERLKININEQPVQRLSHAVIDLASRIPKAKKIELLMGIENIDTKQPIRLLEVGCGSGGIAHYFASHQGQCYEVTAVDVYDNRQVKEGFNFHLVQGVELPFADASFDLVITNHVIEHVGETSEQLQHLKEIARVLSSSGQCYLAVPNRWMLTEPHYRLKFLSWWPKKWRSSYLKLKGKGEFYDCEPLELGELEQLLSQTEFTFENISVIATRVTFEIEKPNSLITRALRRIPDSMLKPLKPIIPTLVYKLELRHE